MTATTLPIDAFIDPMAPSLASLLEALAVLDLPPRRVADLASAVRSLCRVLGKTPFEVPADPGVLGRALRRALPATAGIKPGRWANIKSLVLQALALTGCRVMPGRALHPLTPAWAALMALLPTRYDRAGLSRLMHYGSGQGIPPEAVDQAVFDRFGAAIVNDSFIRNQRTAHQTAARLWNRAVDTIPGWPQQHIAQPRYAKPYVLRLDAFPASFQGEVAAWLGRLAGAGPLEEGPLRPLRPRSLEQRRFYLRQAASALVHSGRDPASITGLGDLVTVAALQAILRFFLARSGNQPTSQIHGIATHLKAIARHHVGASPVVLEQLGRMVRRVAPPQTGLALKNRLALKQFEDPELLRRLVRLPTELYATLPPPGAPLPPRAALRFQWALAVQLLLVAPLRLGNLAGLELDRHLLRIGAGKRLHYQLVIPGDEVKNGQPIELPLPASVSAMLELYRTRVRPVLAPPGTVHLFPGAHGSKAVVTLGGQISRLLARELGVRLTPHQFRHLIGFIYLRANPHGIEVVRVLLGHRSIATTLSHYAGLEGAAAARHYDATLRQVAERPVPVATGRPRQGARGRRQTPLAAA